MNDRAAVLLDRDGVLVNLIETSAPGIFEGPLRPHEVTFRSGAKELVRALAAEGFELAVISNQPGYAKGECTREDLDAVHQTIARELETIHAWFYCHHHPRAVVKELAIVCECRKPNPGLIFQARDELGIDLSQSFMVGDRDVDMEAGRRAGCFTVLAPHEHSGADRTRGTAADQRARALDEVLEIIRNVQRTKRTKR